MTRTPAAALALSLAVAALARPGEAEPCAPRAQLTGDRDAVVRVSAELAKLGVAVEGGSGGMNGTSGGMNGGSGALDGASGGMNGGSGALDGTSGGMSGGSGALDGTSGGRNGGSGAMNAVSGAADGANGARGARCPGVQAQVEVAPEGGIAVAVRGSGARSEGRVVSDAAVAATWIDAWVRDDIDVAGWAPPPSLRSSSPELAPPSRTDPVDEGTRVRPSLASRAVVTASLVFASTADAASWRGLDAGACMLVGRACIGGRVRALFRPDATANMTALARSDLSAELTLSRPLAAAQTIITPEVGAGVGRMSTRRLDGCMTPMPGPNMCDPSNPGDPACVMPPAGCQPDAAGNLDPVTGKGLFVGDHFTTATWTPRVSLALHLAVPLFAHVYLDGIASGWLAPFGHASPFAASSPPPGTAPESVAIPGEPASGWLLGVGLRVGAP